MHQLGSRRQFVKAVSMYTISSIMLPVRYASKRHQKVCFGLVTDSHYADRESSGSRFYRHSLDKMTEFIHEMNRAKVDFIVHLGDFKDEGTFRKSSETLKFLKAIEERYAMFDGPRYHCVGNHDVDSITKSQFLQGIENTGISKEKSYYSFDAGGYHFMVLDANYDKNGEHHFYKEGANWQDTRIPKEQMQWLENELTLHQKPTVVFCHHPLFHFIRDEKIYHASNYAEVQKLFRKNKHVIAVFQGHVHQERFECINDTHFITQLGQVDFAGIENNSFAIVELSDRAIRIKGYKRTSNWRGHLQRK